MASETESAGVPAGLTVGVLCRADEPALEVTLDSLTRAAIRVREQQGREVRFSICVNGFPEPVARGTAAFRAASAFAAMGPSNQTQVIVEPRADKARAWNLVRAWCRTPLLAFCDADVELDAAALAELALELERDPRVALVSAHQIPVLTRGSLVARAAALPQRFDLGVVGGALYMMRIDAVEQMPEGLLFDDAWLSAWIGRQALKRAPGAVVRFRPPATLGDYFRQRLRTEAGKVQLRRLRATGALPPGPVARYPWNAMIRGLSVRDWPLAGVNLAVRCAARAVAELAALGGRKVSWAVVASSKPARDVAP